MTTFTETRSATRQPSFRFRPLNWLLKMDAAYRQKMRFDGLDARLREDMGLPRNERDAEFYGQFRQHGLR